MAARWKPTRAAGPALALLGLLAGCTSVGARASNLEALHSDDGFHRLEAVLYNDFEWEFRQGLGVLVPGSAISVQQKAPERLDDPCEVCLENLRALQGSAPKSGYEAARKVQQLARWARECPWALSRERSLLALVAEAERLQLAEHLPPPPPGETVGAEELGDALAQLVAAVRPALMEDLALDLGNLGAACERLRALSYDLAGARRAMAMVSLLAARAPTDSVLFDPLRELDVELQRLTIHRALSAGLLDREPFERSGSHSGWESPRVRATAIRACVRSFGPIVLGELLATQLDPRQDSEVLLALVGEVRRLGRLPLEEGGLTAEDQVRWRERWIDALVALATSHHDGQLRVATMRALAAISGGELTSLREEDWLVWHKARGAAAGGGGGGSARAGRP